MWFELQEYTGVTVAKWGGDFPVAQDDPVVVLEERKYGLIVHESDPEDEYVLKVGDEEIAVEQKRFRPTVCHFLQEPYFESASGRSTLSVKLRTGDRTCELSSFEFYVLPSKIGQGNYRRMVSDLQTICRSLVNDLVGKSRHSTVWGNQIRSRMYRSREEELRSVEKTWRELSPLLDEIELSPAQAVGRRFALMACSRNRSMRNVPIMMKRGIDPRNPVPGRKCRLTRISLSADTAEHRMIKGFFSVLSIRLRKCREGLEGEIAAIKGDKSFRSRQSSDGTPSLYETEDVPRLAKLRRYAKSVSALQQEIEARTTSDSWRRISSTVDIPCFGQFGENKYYMQVAGIILSYLRNGFNFMPETGDDFTTKKTSRLYEQWLIVQVVSALEVCGLEVDTWDSVVQKSIDSQFGFDFKRNTRFSARLSENYNVSVRYEPWILPRCMVVSYQDETLCHGGQADTFWSPDCVIELQHRERGKLQTAYAVVLDAKYSRSPSEKMRESVAKYQKIRSNVGSRGLQVAKQTWVVYTGPDNRPSGISIDDESMCFLPSAGPVDAETLECIGFDESLYGEIIARPTEKISDDTTLKVRGIVLNDIIRDFVRGTIAYFCKMIK